jgi:hypothetical protein
MPSAIPTASPVAAPAPTQRRLRPVRWFFLLLLILIGSLAVPQVFQVVLGWAVRFEVWRRGGSVRIERIEGSLWEPVVFAHSYLKLETVSGAVTRVEIARAEAQFSWKSLFQRNGERWFRRLSLRGVEGKVQIPLDRTTARESQTSWTHWLPLPNPSQPPLPAAIDAQEINFVFQSSGDFVRLEDASFAASTSEAGEVSVPRLTLSQPWLQRTFRNVRGKAVLQNERIVLADVQLEPGVKLRSLTAAAAELARGELDLKADFAAFDGTLNVEAATKPAGRGVVFEAGGTFGQINIAKLASFLALSDAAGGVIKDGKFTFRGPPRDLARAQASLRFDAVNFQWETRQWDSLALGLVLMDHRLQVPQLALQQGKNELHLSGELALPGAEQKWWQGDFTVNVNAKIENLTELSALLLPEFKYAAGRGQIEGSIRGRGEEFNGQLLVSGDRLTWRNAPIETLHAAVKLNGKEVQIANAELVNGDDYLRGRGLVKFSNPPVYWGELRVAVEDLATYAAFLQKPVLPEPLAGGAIIDWTGEGSREGHSGKFLARLRKVRTLGALAHQLHPINADLEATYGGETMQFSRFTLSDDDAVFTANIAVGGKALHLQDLHFVYRGATQLEGDALLPLDVWQRWPDVSFAQLLSEEVASHVQLTARQLDLAAAAKLTGWNFPVAGLIDGTFAADGALKSLKLGGQLTLAQGRLPLNWNGDLLEQAAGQFAFRDNALVIEKLSAQHRFGDVQLGGTVQFVSLPDPTLALTLRSEKATVSLWNSVTATAQLALEITGPLSAAVVRGTARPASLKLGAVSDLSALWAPEPPKLPPIFSFTSSPWAGWQFDLESRTEAPLKLSDSAGSLTSDLHLGGTGAAPALAGSVGFQDVAANVAGSPPLQIHAASLEFFAQRPANPSLDLQATGRLDGERFSASVAGPLSHLIRIYDGPPPLTDGAVREFLTGNVQAQDEAFGLEVHPPSAHAAR